MNPHNFMLLTEENLSKYIHDTLNPQLSLLTQDLYTLRSDTNVKIADPSNDKQDSTHNELIHALELAIQNTEFLIEKIEEIRQKWKDGVLLTSDEWELLNGIGFVEENSNSLKSNTVPESEIVTPHKSSRNDNTLILPNDSSTHSSKQQSTQKESSSGNEVISNNIHKSTSSNASNQSNSSDHDDTDQKNQSNLSYKSNHSKDSSDLIQTELTNPILPSESTPKIALHENQSSLSSYEKNHSEQLLQSDENNSSKQPSPQQKRTMNIPPPEEIDRLLNISISSDLSFDEQQYRNTDNNNRSSNNSLQDQSRISDYENEITMLKNVLAHKKQSFTKLEEQMKELENTINQQKFENLSKDEEIVKLSSHIKELEEAIHKKEQIISNYEENTAKLQEQIGSLESKQVDQSLTNILDDMKREAELLQTQFQESFSFERNRLMEILGQNKAEIAFLKKAEEEKSQEIIYLNESLRKKDDQIQELTEKIKNIDAEKENYMKEINSLQEELVRHNQTQNNYDSSVYELQQKITALEQINKKLSEDRNIQIQKYITDAGIDLFENVVKGETNVLRSHMEEMRVEMEKKSTSVNRDMQKLKKMVGTITTGLQDPLSDLGDKFKAAEQLLFNLEQHYNSPPNYQEIPNDPIDKLVCQTLNSIKTGSVRIEIKRLGQGEYMIDRPVRVRIVNDQPVIRIGTSYVPLRTYLMQLYAVYIEAPSEELNGNHKLKASNVHPQDQVTAPRNNRSPNLKKESMIAKKRPSSVPKSSSPTIPQKVINRKDKPTRATTPTISRSFQNQSQKNQKYPPKSKVATVRNSSGTRVNSPNRIQTNKKSIANHKTQTSLSSIHSKLQNARDLDETQVKLLKKLALKQQIEMMRQKKL